MTNDDVIAHLRSKLPEYVSETLTRSPKAGEGKYNCPFCGSGEGNNGTGALSITPDGEHFKCFAAKCGVHGDIFDLAGEVESISGFGAQLRFVAEKYGMGHLLTTDTPIKRNDMKTPKKQTTRAMKAKPNEDYSDYCKQAEARLAAPEAKEYLERRGISLEVAREFHLGYDPEWHSPKCWNPRTTTPRIIIPADNGHYTARDIRPGIPKGERYKKVGSVGLFHAEALDDDRNRVVYVTEGEFNAVSIRMGGMRWAVAIGSAAYSCSLLTDRLKAPRTHVLRLILIPDIDKDGGGETSFETLAADIRALGNPNILCAVFKLQDFCPRATFDAAQHAYLAPDGAMLKDANDVLTHLGAIEFGRALGAITKKAEQELNAAPPAPPEPPPPANPPQETGKKEEPHPAQLIDTAAESVDDPRDTLDFQGIPQPPAEEDDDLRDSLETLALTAMFDPDVPPPPHYSTGFPRLDTALGGGLKAGMYLVGATPGRGKTTYVLQIADYIAANQTDTCVLYFSLEMDRPALIARSLSRITYIHANTLPALPADRIQYHWRDLEPDETAALDTARAKLAATGAQRFYFCDNPEGYTAEQIAKTVVESTAKIACNIPPVVIIDYAQYIRPASPNATDKANMDSAMFTLRTLSREHKIPLLIVSSLNRDAYTSQKGITLSAFKESGSLEYTAEAVLGLQPLSSDNGTPDTPADPNNPEMRELDLCILKNRSGRCGDKIRLRYAAAYNFFEEI